MISKRLSFCPDGPPFGRNDITVIIVRGLKRYVVYAFGYLQEGIKL